MKTGKVRIVTFSVIAVSCIIAAVLLFGGQLRWRLYKGDRIEGSLRLYIDGKQCIIDPSRVSGADSAETDDIGTLKYSLKADKYGKYTVDISDTGLGYDIELDYHQFNRWNVYHSDISLYADTAAKTITCEGCSTYLNEQGWTRLKDENTSVQTNGPKVTIRLGTL